MRRDLRQRIEALEREATERVVVWIGPPEAGIEGWEILPGKGADLRIWRDAGESDDALKARAAAEANRHRGMIVCFGMDAQGVTR